MLNAFFLGVVTPALMLTSHTADGKKAIAAASQAYFIQSGLSEDAKDLEKQLLTKEQRKLGATILWTGSLISSQYISYSWSF